jgi:hypothetical protein
VRRLERPDLAFQFGDARAALGGERFVLALLRGLVLARLPLRFLAILLRPAARA